MTLPAGRRWAYVGAGLGAGVSVAANVAHSYVPPAGAAVGWRPHAGAVLLSAFWPVAVLVAVEILARVPWPTGGRWVLVRWAGLVPVAVVAAVVSYRHLSALLAWYGDDPLTAAIGPLAVDGLMVMATAALIATSRDGKADTNRHTDFKFRPPDYESDPDSYSPVEEPAHTAVIEPVQASTPDATYNETADSLKVTSRPATNLEGREQLVDQLAAAAARPGWRPDYAAVQAALATAGLPASRSSAERVVRDARAAARRAPVPAGGT